MKILSVCIAFLSLVFSVFSGYAQQPPNFPMGYRKKIDAAAIRNYINTRSYDELVPVYQKFVQRPFESKQVKPEELYPHASQIVKRLEEFGINRPLEYADISAELWAAKFNYSFYHEVLVTHIQLLDQLFKDEEAFKYTVRAEKYLDFNYAAVNSVYALLLDKFGRHEQMKEVLLESMYRNQSTPEMIGLLAREYLKENKPEAGFSDYLHSLKNKKSN